MQKKYILKCIFSCGYMFSPAEWLLYLCLLYLVHEPIGEVNKVSHTAQKGGQASEYDASSGMYKCHSVGEEASTMVPAAFFLFSCTAFPPPCSSQGTLFGLLCVCLNFTT